MKLERFAPVLATVLISTASMASATVFHFESSLDGLQEVPPVFGTAASGSATLYVDDVTETLTFSLDVIGLSLDDLSDGLIAAPVGPVHLHDGDFGMNGPIVVPFPFGATYSDTADGFSLFAEDVSFADAVAIGPSAFTFGDFLGELLLDGIYINVHSDTFPAGEIRGQLAPVPLPASGLLLAAGGLGLMSLKRKRK